MIDLELIEFSCWIVMQTNLSLPIFVVHENYAAVVMVEVVSVYHSFV